MSGPKHSTVELNRERQFEIAQRQKEEAERRERERRERIEIERMHHLNTKKQQLRQRIDKIESNLNFYQGERHFKNPFERDFNLLRESIRLANAVAQLPDLSEIEHMLNTAIGMALAARRLEEGQNTLVVERERFDMQLTSIAEEAIALELGSRLHLLRATVADLALLNPVDEFSLQQTETQLSQCCNLFNVLRSELSERRLNLEARNQLRQQIDAFKNTVTSDDCAIHPEALEHFNEGERAIESKLGNYAPDIRELASGFSRITSEYEQALRDRRLAFAQQEEIVKTICEAMDEMSKVYQVRFLQEANPVSDMRVETNEGYDITVPFSSNGRFIVTDHYHENGSQLYDIKCKELHQQLRAALAERGVIVGSSPDDTDHDAVELPRSTTKMRTSLKQGG